MKGSLRGEYTVAKSATTEVKDQSMESASDGALAVFDIFFGKNFGSPIRNSVGSSRK
jgi:hypothetical protein